MLWLILIAYGVTYSILSILIEDYDSPYEESRYHISKHPFSKYGRRHWIPITLATLLTLGQLIPSKNTFIALVATPTLVQSLESGKLSKLNTLMDKALDKALKEIDKQGK